ncbi:hypothetical protein T4A_12572 [Trichinella pseudospiralis]|uniref:Uncharacterized protein n=1 Tax=Trichinella pseudospiralis TaxID=6337 RepID=A0A0V1J5R3_TRIPS|nr:hypothetical protein T4A_12572 [Trichinella pseudospiralis]KRZ30305.1 hypothetical protein T4C_2588 [Trichinella pseudospiralis]
MAYLNGSQSSVDFGLEYAENGIPFGLLVSGHVTDGPSDMLTDKHGDVCAGKVNLIFYCRCKISFRYSLMKYHYKNHSTSEFLSSRYLNSSTHSLGDPRLVQWL